MNWKGCKGKSTAYTTILAVALKDLEELQKISVRLINVSAEVQTEHLSRLLESNFLLGFLISLWLINLLDLQARPLLLRQPIN